MHTSVVAVTAELAKTKSSSGSSYGFLILIAIFVIAYLVLIRPARNRQRAAMADRGKCEVGDEVTTTSGLIATVVAVDDDAVTLEVAPGVHCRYVPASIMRVNLPEEPAADETAGEHEAIDPGEHEVIEPEDIDQPHPDDPAST